MFAYYATILLVALALSGTQIRGATVVGIRGPQFTLNGQLTYSAAAGFPQADPNLAGTLLNVRAVQGIFDDANYPQMGSRERPYHSNTLGNIFNITTESSPRALF